MAEDQSIIPGKRTHLETADSELKRCRKCSTLKPLDAFGEYKNGRCGRKARCKDCLTKERDWRDSRSDNQLCIRCSQPFERTTKHRMCRPCLDNANTTWRKRATSRRARNLCTQCGQRPPEANRFDCRPCLDKAGATAKRLRAERIAAGLCFRCGREPIATRHRRIQAQTKGRQPLCRSCYIKVAANTALGSDLLAPLLEAKLEAQGGRCPYTGEILILGMNDSIDHILPISRFPELAGDINNVEWVSLSTNIMKRHLTKEEFLEQIRLIARHDSRDKGIW